MPKLVFFYQTRDTYNPDTHELEFEAPDNATPQLFLTTGELERQKAPGVFFLRCKGATAVNDQKPEEDLTYATLPARAMEGLQVPLVQLYLPMLEAEQKGWSGRWGRGLYCRVLRVVPQVWRDAERGRLLAAGGFCPPAGQPL